jgi:hypothetical protein
MSRRRLLGAGVLLGVLLGALALPAVRWQLWGRLRGEAFYRGRPTSYWTGRLRTESCEVRQYADPRARGGMAVRVVTRPGPYRPPVIGRLCRLLGVGPPAEEVLFDGGEAGRLVPVLIELLKDPDPSVVRVAALSLGALGPAARESAPALAAALAACSDENLRLVLAYALSRTAPHPDEAARVLAGMLRDQDKSRATRAASVLERLGPDAGAAVPALAEAVKDADPNLSAQAARALKEIDPQAAAAAGVP